MLNELMKNIEQVNDFINQEKLFHPLSVQTQEQIINVSSISKKHHVKYSRIINENKNLLSSFIKNKDFKNNWSVLTDKNKLDIILSFNDAYINLRTVLALDDLLLITPKDYYMKNLPMQFFEIINLDIEKLPQNEQQLQSFKNKIIHRFSISEKNIISMNKDNLESEFKQILYKSKHLFNIKELNLFMIKNNLISGYVLFVSRYILMREQSYE